MKSQNIRQALLVLGLTLISVAIRAEDYVVAPRPDHYAPVSANPKKPTSRREMMEQSVSMHKGMVLGDSVNSASVKADVIPVVPVSTHTYQPPFSNLRISIVDGGLGLSSDELSTLYTLLSQLPQSHIKDIRSITLKPVTDSIIPIVDGSNLTVFADTQFRKSEPDVFKQSQRVDLMSAIAYHLFYNVLNKTQDRDDLRSFYHTTVANNNDPGLPFLFSAEYANYTIGTMVALKDRALAADLQVAQQNAAQAGNDPSQIKADPAGLRAMLFTMALFAHPEQGVVRVFNDQGQQDYVRLRRTDDWLSIGNIHFALRGDRIVGFTNQDVYAPGNTLISYTPWDPGVFVPYSVFQRIPKSR